MVLNHIGINIADRDEVVRFYQNVLGCFPERSFPLSADISRYFFAIEDNSEVFVVKNEDFTLELFLYDKPLQTGYAHLCVEMDDREQVARKCTEMHYPVLRRKREKGDLIFVKDKAGNVFELKNKTV